VIPAQARTLSIIDSSPTTYSEEYCPSITAVAEQEPSITVIMVPEPEPSITVIMVPEPEPRITI
jgi:hypothetical protein